MKAYRIDLDLQSKTTSKSSSFVSIQERLIKARKILDKCYKDVEDFDVITKAMDISWDIKKILAHKHGVKVSNSWMKIWELICFFNLPRSKHNTVLSSSPYAIDAIRRYSEKFKKKSTILLDEPSLLYPECDLYISDLNIEFDPEKFDYEESFHSYFYSQFLRAFSTLKLRGTLIIKNYGLFSCNSRKILFLVLSLFEEVHLVKPLTSKNTSTEIFLVCIGKTQSKLPEFEEIHPVDLDGIIGFLETIYEVHLSYVKLALSLTSFGKLKHRQTQEKIKEKVRSFQARNLVSEWFLDYPL